MDREIQQLFASQQATIALKKDGKLIVAQFGRGIGPALSLYDEQPELLRGADVFDTIVGKAAASIFILAGVRSVYGQTMSQSAVQLLTRHGVACSYETVTPQIINRTGTGLCPFEQAVLTIDEPEACLRVIRETLAHLRANAPKS